MKKPACSQRAGSPEIQVSGLFAILAALAPVDESFKSHATKSKSDNDHDYSNPVAHQVVCRSTQELHNDSGEPIQSLAEIVAGKADQGHTGYRTEHVLR